MQKHHCTVPYPIRYGLVTTFLRLTSCVNSVSMFFLPRLLYSVSIENLMLNVVEIPWC